MAATETNKEETLDPQDWEGFRRVAHLALDTMLDYLEHVRDRPVWQPLPASVISAFRAPVPRSPRPFAEVFEEIRSHILPYPTGNIHPRFWGWVMGTGTPGGMVADMLASGINLNQGGLAQVGNLVESQVIAWCNEMLGFPPEASGILVSGGSMANLTALAVARNARAGYDIRAEGLQGEHPTLRVYASREVHSSVQKALELLGLGRKSLRLIPAESSYAIDTGALRRAIAEDRARGYRPLCVVGCAGTVNTAAIDPLEELADICAAEGIWFHVDGAFGALAVLSPELRERVRGLERADSIAFDMHKWIYLPYEVGCTLVRNGELHYQAFTLTPEYLEHATRGLASGERWFSDYGMELSRGFRALKVWAGFQEHGIEKFGRLILQNVRQAEYLASRVRENPRLELLAPVSLNIVCFRYIGDAQDDERRNALNKELLLRLHEGGIAAPSYTVLNDRYALRVSITNHRSVRDDFDLLLGEVLRIGRELERLGTVSSVTQPV